MLTLHGVLCCVRYTAARGGEVGVVDDAVREDVHWDGVQLVLQLLHTAAQLRVTTGDQRVTSWK